MKTIKLKSLIGESTKSVDRKIIDKALGEVAELSRVERLGILTRARETGKFKVYDPYSLHSDPYPDDLNHGIALQYIEENPHKFME